MKYAANRVNNNLRVGLGALAILGSWLLALALAFDLHHSRFLEPMMVGLAQKCQRLEPLDAAVTRRPLSF